ncbi:non-hydrolyzing UDP-N-acetylglucosamine 2-epimerase [Achromobacter xylosoxidans]|uniref:non-hydrolyzing UDP-N-acetylglucosamine 2-epimerase n=1 Tax=Alcaligenes xylosoxydans xylosoxydans TaxID=85698 RepID=UPI002A7514F0|nr:UDP-N-acetylglucosamine 2-epimerase (non-hydrolyzing) [Achromobacter xylosoxidans]WPQ32747.1 UDP-N-acetylglucosamine 2-epimerase (non-hydrolyzing) [Achromobacter xylosoxidans]
MKRILTVLGARPQFIKASVVSAALAQQVGLAEIVVHTGQHFDANMSDVFFAELGMGAPQHHLGIHGGTHAHMTSRMLAALEDIMLSEKPDIVMVYGDTNSTLAGALAAAKLNIPIAHVEAGLRSHNMRMPEEVNRILADRISRWLFTPTNSATRNLRQEGVPAERIVQTGDVMFDVALQHGARSACMSSQLARLGLADKGYVLATIHRQENTDDPQRLGAIVDGLIAAAARRPVVWPLHPRTRQILSNSDRLARLQASRVVLIDPVGYLDMVQLEKHAALIATDSGGVQKEAFFHQVPCVTLRDETEWMELVDSGWNRLADTRSSQAITAALDEALNFVPQPVMPYGQGDAATRIAAALADAA